MFLDDWKIKVMWEKLEQNCWKGKKIKIYLIEIEIYRECEWGTPTKIVRKDKRKGNNRKSQKQRVCEKSIEADTEWNSNRDRENYGISMRKIECEKETEWTHREEDKDSQTNKLWAKKSSVCVKATSGHFPKLFFLQSWKKNQSLLLLLKKQERIVSWLPNWLSLSDFCRLFNVVANLDGFCHLLPFWSSLWGSQFFGDR